MGVTMTSESTFAGKLARSKARVDFRGVSSLIQYLNNVLPRERFCLLGGFVMLGAVAKYSAWAAIVPYSLASSPIVAHLSSQILYHKVVATVVANTGHTKWKNEGVNWQSRIDCFAGLRHRYPRREELY